MINVPPNLTAIWYFFEPADGNGVIVARQNIIQFVAREIETGAKTAADIRDAITNSENLAGEIRSFYGKPLWATYDLALKTITEDTEMTFEGFLATHAPEHRTYLPLQMAS